MKSRLFLKSLAFFLEREKISLKSKSQLINNFIKLSYKKIYWLSQAVKIEWNSLSLLLVLLFVSNYFS